MDLVNGFPRKLVIDFRVTETEMVQRLSSLTSLFTVAVGVFRRGGSQELAPAMERDRGGVPSHHSPEPEVDSERGF